MPWIVFVACMAHMLYTHCVRELNHVPLTTIEISSMHMVLVMNLTSFAWSCRDGQLVAIDTLDEVQKAVRITQMPSLLAYLGYCFYFPGVLVGPSTRFQTTSCGRRASCTRRPRGRRAAAGPSPCARWARRSSRSSSW